MIAAVFDSISVEEYKYVEGLCEEEFADSGVEVTEACAYIVVSSRALAMLQLLALFFVSWTWIVCFYLMWSLGECMSTVLHTISDVVRV